MQEAYVVVSPQLQTTGADAEDAGEKLSRFKEPRDVKVLGQVWELLSQISRRCVSPEDRNTRTKRRQGKKKKMALPVLRGCHRFPSTFRCVRLFLNESITLNRSGRTRLPPSAPAPVTAASRPYSSDGQNQNRNQKVVVVGIPNPFIWLRTRIYYFLIRAYFDKEFNIQEFTEGAKQAFSHVSRAVGTVSV
ncbi:hypothetical protein FQN60_001540 [Etheostoma spectabile]|uniref:Uncharacterized protein n=1 Tax=Etheostoma spectabile TaxID=54343 RepID=A0A5J5D6T6_9PERO|nr:hypothetical protein FQN60_001540 [Etheostoma spectabile]